MSACQPLLSPMNTHLWECVSVVCNAWQPMALPTVPGGLQRVLSSPCTSVDREEQPEECCIGISSVPAWTRASFIGKTDAFGRCIVLVRCLALLSGPGLRGKGKEHHDCKTTGFIPFLS